MARRSAADGLPAFWRKVPEAGIVDLDFGLAGGALTIAAALA